MSIFTNPELVKFHDALISFPVSIYYFLFILVIFYFFLTILGIFDFDADIDVDIDVGDGADASSLGWFSGVLYKFGLYGVPFVFIFAIIVFIGLGLCFYPSVYVNNIFNNGIIRFVIGVPIFLITLLVSMIITGRILKPIRAKIPKPHRKSAKTLLGKTATVRTSVLNNSFGEVVLDDGGAGLILKGRSADKVFNCNDKVVLINYDEEANVFFVIAEAEFESS